jgi:FlaA1/EpsC-like NDP-sugar epimerase
MIGALNRRGVNWLLRHRYYLLVVAHLGVFLVCYELAYQFRLNFSVSSEHRVLFWKTLPWVLALKVAAFHCVGAFQGWWRYVTFADLASLLWGSAVSTVAIALVDYFFLGDLQIPRLILLLDLGTTILCLGGLRSFWRLGREHVWPIFRVDRRRPALMIGAGQRGEMITRQIHENPQLNYRIVGYLDDDPSRHGSRLGGIPFLAGPGDAVELARKQNIQDVLVAAGGIAGKRLRTLMEECREADIDLKMIPPIDELLNGSFRLRIRDVDINDLLRREPVELDWEDIATLLGEKRVMVTGAGGSIGSELCRQILKRSPSKLILVERAENNLFFIDQELNRLPIEAPFSSYVADVADRGRMRMLFQRHAPQIIFHAAANKHVPLMETNPAEAIKNNVLGTKVMADLADEFGTDRFVLISTDKAVHPTSVMGVTKLIAERYLHAISETSTSKFVVVRFGNVLGSTASVVPIFQEQIRRGGPITITHPEMRRYFMTISEACQLVLQAATLGEGGEVFVLDMGEPVKIVDLAHDLILLSGLSPEDIQVTIVGPRPGEKLVEEVLYNEEETLPTPHPKLRLAYNRPYPPSEIRELITQLLALCDKPEKVIRRRLKRLADEHGLAGLPLAASGAAESRGGNGTSGNGKGGSRDKRLPVH